MEISRKRYWIVLESGLTILQPTAPIEASSCMTEARMGNQSGGSSTSSSRKAMYSGRCWASTWLTRYLGGRRADVDREDDFLQVPLGKRGFHGLEDRLTVVGAAVDEHDDAYASPMSDAHTLCKVVSSRSALL